MTVLMVISLAGATTAGTEKVVTASTILNPPEVTVSNANLVASAGSKASFVIDVQSSTSGTFYLAVADSKVNIMSPADMTLRTVAPLPLGLGVSYETASSAANLAEHNGWYITVNGVNSFKVKVTLSLSGVGSSSIPLQVAVFQLTNGGRSALGTINYIQLQVNQ